MKVSTILSVGTRLVPPGDETDVLLYFVANICKIKGT